MKRCKDIGNTHTHTYTQRERERLKKQEKDGRRNKKIE